MATQVLVVGVVAMAALAVGYLAATRWLVSELRAQGARDVRVTDLAGELQRVNDLVARLQRDRAQQHGEVMARLGESVRVTSALSETTQSLRQALASPKARGQWGERMAEDVLRAAGLAEGVSYRRQTALPGGGVPDITFFLPHGLLLHMDVKFPIDNYLRHLEAPTDTERDVTRTAFLRDVRGRVKELAGRGYADPTTTPGFLLLFIPNEAVYGFVHEHDPGLLDVALAQRVVLCSPCTLFAVLGVLRQAVDAWLVERASDEVLQALAGFAAQWERFGEHLDTLGGRLASANKAYEELAGTRRRQLERRLDEIEAIRHRHGLADAVLRDVAS